jgi:hypothetical protein
MVASISQWRGEDKHGCFRVWPQVFLIGKEQVVGSDFGIDFLAPAASYPYGFQGFGAA